MDVGFPIAFWASCNTLVAVFRDNRRSGFLYRALSTDDGRTWSTPWVIDDPKVYFVKRPQMATTKPTRR